jgi:hypothetical protein
LKKEVEGRKKVTDFITKDYVDKVKEYHRLRLIDPEAAPRNYEVEVVNKHGRTSNICLTVAIIPGTDRSVASLLDITEIKKTEFELIKRKELLYNTNKALEHKLKELQAATGHIKNLEGLVPICADCKKMLLEDEDPKDATAWVSLEKYISERTDASFTHGLCPDCMKKAYGRIRKRKS